MPTLLGMGTFLTPAEVETGMLVHLLEQDVARYGGDPTLVQSCEWKILTRTRTGSNAYDWYFEAGELTIQSKANFR